MEIADCLVQAVWLCHLHRLRITLVCLHIRQEHFQAPEVPEEPDASRDHSVHDLNAGDVHPHRGGVLPRSQGILDAVHGR
jgi:hypothetical protein